MTAKQYDNLDDAAIVRLAHQALSVYLWLTPQRVSLFCRSENATLRVIDHRNQGYALHIHRLNYHLLADIRSELCWLQALQADGIPVPQARLPLPCAPLTVRPTMRCCLTGLTALYCRAMSIACVKPISWCWAKSPRAYQQSRQWPLPAEFSRLTWDHDSMIGADGHWGHWRAAPGRLRAH